MKKLFSIIAMLLLMSDVIGQQTAIFGTIRDEATGEPLFDAAIYIDSLQIGSTSNENGYYELHLQPGSHLVRYSFLGYKTLEERVIVTNSRKRVNINLSMESQILDKVLITSKKKDANVKELAMSTQKLDMIRIRKIPALMGETDVIKAIQMLPGVQAASEGSSGFAVRGGSPDQNLIILDDATIYNPSHFIGFFSVFNNDAIKEATLYKGDIPASFDNRLSSVLDVRTIDEIPDRLTLNGGIGVLTSRLMINAPMNKQRTSLMLAGRLTYGGVLAPLLIDDIKDARLHFYDINAKITHIINNNNRIFISGYYGFDNLEMMNAMGFGYGNNSLTTRWNHIFNSKLTSNLSLIYTNYRYKIGVSSDPFEFSVSAGIKDLAAKYDFTYIINDKMTSKFGLSTTFHGYNQGQLDDKNGAVAMYLSVSSNETIIRKALESALYFSNEHTINPLLSIRYGIRLSMFNNIGDETLYLFDENYHMTDSVIYKRGEVFHTQANIEPRFAIKYQLGATSSIKASYSRTVQYAQLAANSTGGLPFDVWFPTSPNIKPQKCDQLAAGYFRNFRGNDIETSVEIFYKNLKNVIDFADNAFFYGNVLIDGEVRVGKGRSYGAEFLIRKNYGRLTGWLSYTYSRSFRTVKGISHDKEYRSPYDRPHNISIVLNYTFNDRLDISANWIYNTGQPVTYPCGKYTDHGVTYPVYNGYRNQNRYPDYHRLDLSATWKCRKHKTWQGEWNISIYNVYARHNTWAVMFTQSDNNIIQGEKMYLFSFVPSISYNFKL